MNMRYDAESRMMYNEDGTIYNPPDNVRTVLAEMYHKVHNPQLYNICYE